MRLGKGFIWVTFCLLWLLVLPIKAAENQKIIIDNFGNINCYWLEKTTGEGTTKQQFKQSFFDNSKAKTLFSISQEAISFDFCRNNNDFNIIMETRDHQLAIINTTNGGRDIAATLNPDFSGQNPVIARYDREIILAYEKANNLKIRQSHDEGQSFTLPVYLQITGEVISSPQIIFDNDHQFKIIYLSQNKLSGQFCLWQSVFTPATIYNPIKEIQRQLIYQTYNKISNLHFSQLQKLPIILWQEQAFGSQQSFFSLSLDQGQTYTYPRLINLNEEIQAIEFYKGKLAALAFEDNKIKALDLFANLPNPPAITTTPPLYSNNKTVTLLSCSNTNNEPIFYQLTISPQIKPDQPIFIQNQLPKPTDTMVTFTLSPETLAEGKYVWQIIANNGLAESQPTKPEALIIDKTLPTLTTLEALRTFAHLSFTGQLDNSAAQLTINELPQTLGINNTFCATFELISGNNLFCFKISDEANNLLLVSREVFYDPASPEVAVILGNGGDWLKSGTTILLRAIINDPQNIIANKEFPQLTLGGINSEAFLSYEEETSSLSGFINLPPGLKDGQQTGTLTFQYQNGSKQGFPFTFKIGTSPEITVFSNNVATPETSFFAPPPTVNLLSGLTTGPNPFSPSRDLPAAFAVGEENKGMIFAYSLVQPADVKIRIYDITGTLIWVKEVPAASSGVTTWSGADQSGQFVPNGIYPFFFTVSSGGLHQTRKGKIVVYQ